MRFKKLIAAVVLAASLIVPTTASAYSINTQYALGSNEGSSQRTSNNYILAHDTGAPGSALNTGLDK